MTPLRRLVSYLGRHKPSLILGALCVTGSVAFSLIKPLIVGGAVDQIQADLSREVLLRFAALFVGASAIEGAFLFLQRRIIIGASRHIEYDMRGDFYDHLQSLPMGFYNEHRTGDLMSRATNDLSAVRMLIGPAIMHSATSVLVVTGAFIMMLRIEPTLAFVSLAAVPVIAGAVKFFGERIHVRFKNVQDQFGDLSARVQENLAGVRVVRAFGQESNEVETFRLMNRDYVEKNRSLVRITATFYPLLHGIIGLLFVAIFYLGAVRMLAGTLTLGEFVAFQFYLGRMVWPLIALGWVINLFQRGTASMRRLSEIWDIQPPVDDGVRHVEEGPVSLEIRDLTFGYGERPVLRDVSLQVRAGETIGIVGRTGSGKSTLLGLLTGMWAPPPGTVVVAGSFIEDLSRHTLRELVGMVPQETFLFSDSLAENIRFGRADAVDEEVRRAADLAGLETDLATFPNGLDTVIGERGITLSGGQKQRTAIARAIVRNPRLLILDDSLSAVDTATEERILDSIERLREGRTVIIVSHRVSTVKTADRIYVLGDGRIVEQGTHDGLIERGGYYADLYAQQTLEEQIEEIA